MAKKKVLTISPDRRKEMIDKNDLDLSVRSQCECLCICRSSLYYHAVSKQECEFEQMVISEYEIQPGGYRNIWQRLKLKGVKIGRDRVYMIMKENGLKGFHPRFRKPNTSAANKKHSVYKYLLKDLEIAKANQAWSTDITYIRTPHGFMYFTAIMDISSRCILSWKLSNTMETDFCIRTLNEALMDYGKPQIFNTDQGTQYTSHDFTNRLKENDIQISMTGKGRCLDNVFIERFWWSLKHECLHHYEYKTAGGLRTVIDTYIDYYNHGRPHSSLGYQTPSVRYSSTLTSKNQRITA